MREMTLTIMSGQPPVNYAFFTMGDKDAVTAWYNNHADIATIMKKPVGDFVITYWHGYWNLFRLKSIKGKYGQLGWKTVCVGDKNA